MKKPKRIAVIGASCFPARGGAERLIDFIASNLQARGDHVRVFVPETLQTGSKYIKRIPFRPPPAPYEIELLTTRLPTEGPLSPAMSAEEQGRGADCPGLDKALLGFAADVLIAVAPINFHVSNSVLIASKLGIPSVLWGAPHFDEDWVKWPSVRKAGASASIYCALSYLEADLVRRFWRDDGAPIKVVHPCHFRANWEPEVRESRVGPRKLLYFGRLSKRKKLDYLLGEVARYSASLAKNELSLTLAGSSQADFRDELHRLADAVTDSGVPVRILENISEADKQDLFSDSDWVLMPSPDESFGLSNLEAFAGGGRVLLPDTALNREIYGDRYMDQAGFSAGAEGSLAARLERAERGDYSEDVRLETILRLRGTFRLEKFAAEVISTVELALNSKSKDATASAEMRNNIS